MAFSAIFYEKKEQPTLGGGIFVHSTLLLASCPLMLLPPHPLSGASNYMHIYLAILFRVKYIPSFFGTSSTTTHTICHIITF
jgi:hypothetical protein